MIGAGAKLNKRPAKKMFRMKETLAEPGRFDLGLLGVFFPQELVGTERVLLASTLRSSATVEAWRLTVAGRLWQDGERKGVVEFAPYLEQRDHGRHDDGRQAFVYEVVLYRLVAAEITR